MSIDEFIAKRPQADEPKSGVDQWLESDPLPSQVGTAFHFAGGQSPEIAAKILDLRSRTGLPQDLIERNLSDIQVEVEKQEFDPSKFARTSPVVAAWAAQSPQHAAALKDDLDNLNALEGLSKDYSAAEKMYQTIGQGLANLNKGAAQVPAYAYDLFAIPQNLLAKAMGRPDFQVRSPEWLRENAVSQYYGEAAQGYGEKVPELSDDIVDLVGKGEWSKAGKALAYQVTASAPQSIALLVANALGAGTPGLAATGAIAAAQKSAEGNAAGRDPVLNTIDSTANGLFEAAFEQLGTLSVVKKIEASIVQKFGKDTWKKIGVDVTKQLLAGSIQEGAEEAATSVAQDTSSYFTGGNPDLTMSGVAKNALNAGIVGAASSGPISGPFGALGAYQRGAQMKAAQRLVDFHTALGETAKDSKLRARLPEAHQQLIEKLTKDGPVKDVHMPVEAFESYFQSKNLDPAAEAQKFGFGPEFTEAKQTGADVKVPLSKFVANLVDTEHYQGLANDIKYSPEALTFNESKAEAKLQEKALKLVNSEAAVEESKSEAELTSDELAVRQAREIKAQLKQELMSNEQSLYAPAQAEASAAQFAAFIYTAAQRSGQTPMDLFNRYVKGKLLDSKQETGSQVLAAQGQVLNQSASKTDSPEFKNWFQSSKVVDESGAPLVVYHGTDQKIEAFKHKRSADGFYFTSNKNLARDYAKDSESNAVFAGTKATVYPTYLSMQNPLVVDGSDGSFDFGGESHDRLIEQAKANGHDGVIIRNTQDDISDSKRGRSDTYIAFDSTQIKSTKNNGKFDPKDPRILFQSAAQAVADQYQGRELYQPTAPKPIDATEYFENPDGKGDVELPRLPKEILQKLGVEDKPVVIKEKIARKNHESHPEIKPGQDAEILRSAIYSPDEVVQSKPAEKPNYYTFIKEGDAKSDVSVIEISVHKENYEVVNWYRIKQKQLGQIKKRAEREGGLFLITEETNLQGSAGLSDLTLRSVSKNTSESPENQGGQFEQGNESGAAPRGRIVISSNRTMQIDLFKGADLSTFLHETGHFYLEVLQDLSKDPRASAQLKADYQTVRDWLGAKGDGPLTESQHEQFARGFELYLTRGEAPTSELREAFAAFKVWLSNIYKNLRRLDVELNDDIKGVMDRLLATDEQLAEAVRGQPALLENATSLTLSPAEYEEYKRLENEEKRAASEELTAKVLKHEMQKREAAYKEARREVRSRVENEANQMQVYKALAVLQKGTQPDGSPLPEGVQAIKLDRQSIVDAYGKEFLDRLPRPYVYAKEGGVHFNAAAEMLGYESGDAMLKSIAEMPSKKDYVERETDREMDLRFPDEVMEKFPEEAIRAAHADPKRKRLVFELEKLAAQSPKLARSVIQKTVARVPREADVKAQAIKMIGAKKIEEIKPYTFERAERKAAREAGVALSKGDIAAAFEAKRKELLNYELYKAAIEAQDSVESASEFFKKFRQKDEDLAKSRDTNLINVGRAILAAYGLGKSDKTSAEYLKSMKSYDPEGYESAVAIIENSGLTPDQYDKVSFDEFTAMHDTVRALWDLAKQVKSIEIDGKRISRDEIKAEFAAQAASIATVKEQGEQFATMSDSEKRGISFLSLRAGLVRMEHWATGFDRGNRSGAMTKYFINPIRDAITKYRLMKKEYVQQAKDILDPIKATLGADRVIAAPEIGTNFRSKAELLGAILHTGNESNLEKLLVGYGWGEKLLDGTLDTSKWDKFVARMWATGELTKADYDAIQGVWDLMEKLKPDAQKAHKAMYGFYFSEITAKEIVTPFGTYRGGYAPAKSDPYTVDAAGARADQAAVEGKDNTFAFPTTGRGATKTRVENYHAKLQLDIRLALQHVDWALRFTYLEPRVKELGRLATDQSFRATMKTIDPEIVSGALIPWLQRVARQTVTTPSASKGGRFMDKIFTLMRSRSSLQMMAFNFTNAMQNFTALFPTALRVRPGLMMDNFWRFSKGPKEFAEYVAAKSPYMSTRLGEQARDIQNDIEQILENPSKFESAREWMIKHSQVLQSATQNTIDTVVWSSAYDQAIGKGMSELESVRYADATVREALGAMGPEDVSSLESGSPLVRALTMFYGFFNNQANFMGAEFSIHKELGLQKRAASAFYAYTLVVMAPAIVGALMSRALGNGLDDDGDGEYVDDMLDVLFMSQFKYMTAMLPGGGILNSVMNRFNDSSFDDRIQVSPILTTLEKTTTAPFTVAKAIDGNGKTSSAIKDSLTAIGFITGIPGGAIARPLGYLADVNEGKANPTGPIDFTRGVVTGKPGEPYAR